MRGQITFILFSILTYTVSAQRYGFDTFSLEQGLPQSGVYDIEQDSRGFLWIATEGGGAACFDGFKFDIWDTRRGLSDDMVRCLHEGSDGRFWLGTQYGGVNIIDGNTVAIIDTSTGLSSQHIRSIVEDKLGTTWIGTLGGGMFQVDQNGETSASPFELPSNKIRASAVDSDSLLWIGTDEGLAIWNGKKLNVLTKEDGLPHSKILSIFPDYDGSIWIGTQSGIARWANGQLTDFLSEELGQERIKSITRDQIGNLWFGTRNGLYRFVESEDNLDLLTRNNGLSNERIRDLFLDRNGALWVGTFFGGVCRLTNQSFNTFGAEHGFPENNVTAIYEDSKDNIWLGTFDGTVYLHDGKETQKVFVTPMYMTDDYVLDFEEIQPGEIWACTSEGRVERFVDGSYISDVKSVFNHSAVSISASKTHIVICTQDGVLIDGEKLSSDLISGKCNTSLTLDQNNILIGKVNGVFHLKDENGDGKIDSSVALKGTRGADITSIVIDSQKNVWIGSSNEGFFSYHSGEIQRYKSRRYLSSYTVNFLALDAQENLWIGTPKGLDFIELSPDQSMPLNHEFYGVEEGFHGGETNRGSAFVDHRGDLWIGTIRGVSRKRDLPPVFNSEPPRLEITSILLADSPVEWSQYQPKWQEGEKFPISAQFGHNDNHLTFSFRGIDVSAPEGIKYQFKLEGHDLKWGPITPLSSHSYSSLTNGEYAFKVRSCNGQGIWNEEPVSFAFSIAPPLFLRPWFIALVILVAAGVVFLGFRLRLRFLQKEKEILEAKVVERTLELQEEKKKTDELLHNILPHETAVELIESGQAKTRHYESVSVLFSDFKGFTQLSEKLEPNALVNQLDEYFKLFDSNTAKFGIEKIKTIGDAYMCAAGLPNVSSNHAQDLVGFAFTILESVEQLNSRNAEKGLPNWQLRIGIHSGPVIAGVVGDKKFAYDIWGDTVNIASRMESSGSVGQINISEATHVLISDQYECEARGKIEAKNKGSLDMFFVLNSKNQSIHESLHKERG